MIAKFVTDKRPIIEVTINGRKAYMLVDTGASIGVIDSRRLDEYGVGMGSSLGGTTTGVGGSQEEVRHTKNCMVEVGGINLYQFVTFDLSSVASSIERETGIKISGIIGTTQIKMSEMKIDLDNGYIKIGY